MNVLRAYIVDDEPLARRRIRALLEPRSDVEIAGESGDGRHAVEGIRRANPDLVFLDVRMPGFDGFEVLKSLPPEATPMIVFVTAFGDHAVSAFEVHAVDYVLKPFEDERLIAALDRVRSLMGRDSGRALRARLRALLEDPPEARGHVRSGSAESSITVRSAGRTVFVRSDSIDWVSADGCYVQLHVGDRSYLLRETMTRLLARLGEEAFARVHRSAIVNLTRLREVKHAPGGAITLALKSGEEVEVSRRYRSALKTRLGL